MRRSLPAAALLLTVCAALLVALGWADEAPAPKPAAAPPRVLPGAQPSGAKLLHNQWSLRPAGKQVRLGDLPVNLALRSGGHWLAALHAGYSEQRSPSSI